MASRIGRRDTDEPTVNNNPLWFKMPDAPIRSLEDVRLVIRQLRKYGGRDA